MAQKYSNLDSLTPKSITMTKSNDYVIHLFRKWQLWCPYKCTAFFSCYGKYDWLMAPTIVPLVHPVFILMLHLLPSTDWSWQSNMWDSSNVDFGLRTLIGLTKSSLNLFCSTRLFLPNSPSFPLYHSCQTYIISEACPGFLLLLYPINLLHV